MKVRTSFVTNSSSTSYIAVFKDYKGNPKDDEVIKAGISNHTDTYTIGDYGCTEFTRSHNVSKDFWSKLNFVAEYSRYNQELRDLVNEMVYSKLNLKLDWSKVDNDTIYIDHQSCANGEVLSMIKDKSLLESLLFCPESIIIMDSDEVHGFCAGKFRFFIDRSEYYRTTSDYYRYDEEVVSEDDHRSLLLLMKTQSDTYFGVYDEHIDSTMINSFNELVNPKYISKDIETTKKVINALHLYVEDDRRDLYRFLYERNTRKVDISKFKTFNEFEDCCEHLTENELKSLNELIDNEGYKVFSTNLWDDKLILPLDYFKFDDPRVIREKVNLLGRK